VGGAVVGVLVLMIGNSVGSEVGRRVVGFSVSVFTGAADGTLVAIGNFVGSGVGLEVVGWGVGVFEGMGVG